MIDKKTIERVTEAASIVDVVGESVTLKKKGVNYVGLCPFHEDRHIGSFFVSEVKNVCNCFACNCNGKGALDPIGYLMEKERMSYLDAIRYLGKKYGIEVEGADKLNVKPSKPRTPPPPLPMQTHPISFVKNKRDTSNDNLCNWMRSLNWDNMQRGRIEQVLKNYGVGHSKQGMTIFWQMDENGVVRAGKMIRYKTDGHRCHEGYSADWVHSAMERTGKQEPYTYELKQCLFGLHLIDMAKATTVNIVESEKTAILCTIAYGNMKRQLWMATGGMSNLTREKLQPLIERKVHIVLYPDKDGEQKWKERAELINYKHLSVNRQFMHTYWQEEDGPKADIADIIVRWLGKPEKTFDTIEDVFDRWPALRELHETFPLELVKDNNR